MKVHPTNSVHSQVEKFLQRIKAPDLDLDELQANGKENASKLASQLHDYTHGLTTDPMTPLAILFSALIHDVDHRGCSNSQLEKEEKKMAKTYKGKSTAEQNSLDISWGLFMSPMCKDLRAAMFASQGELKRFRQLLVNVVLATDIFDKELNGARKARWNKAFSSDGASNADLRATIVIEHIIQASDVSHTMQVGTHDSTMSVSGSHLLYFSSSALACVSQMESQVVYGDVPCL